MHITTGMRDVDVRQSRLAESIETASSLLRSSGKIEDAVALFRLRIKIREGLSYEEAKVIFEKHTQGILCVEL